MGEFHIGLERGEVICIRKRDNFENVVRNRIFSPYVLALLTVIYMYFFPQLLFFLVIL